MANIALCDDHYLINEGLRSVLTKSGHQIVATLGNGHELIEYVRSQQVDVVLLDLSMPVLNGFDALVQMRELSPGVRCIVMTMHEDPERIARAFHNGAAAYLIKKMKPEEMCLAVEKVLRGEKYLANELGAAVADYLSRVSGSLDAFVGSRVMTQREREVLQLVGEGKTAKEISVILNIAVSTVQSHIERIKVDFDCPTKADLVRLAMRLKLIDP